MRLSRRLVEQTTTSSAQPRSRRGRATILLALLLATTLAPTQLTGAAPQLASTVSDVAASVAPGLKGVDLTLEGPQLQSGGVSSEAHEKSFKGDLVIPKGSTQAVFTSDSTRAPVAFTHVAPHWWAETPTGTSVSVEIRTSPNGLDWPDWQPADLEDMIMPEDSITETYASMIGVEGPDRTHQFVQSRVTLTTSRAGTGPIFHQLTYTFIDAGVTLRQPRPQMMIQGTPSDVPKPLIVSRNDWGSPQGESSPDWTPKYKRVTHIVIHHTATPNNVTDWAAQVRAIWYFHTFTRGWGDVGYNYLIDPNGVIYEGRSGGEDVEAGHAYPFNGGTMGIGMIGNFMTATPTAAAQAALIDLIAWKVNQRGIDPQGTAPITGYTNCGGSVTYTRPTIAGHRDYKGIACGKAFNNSTCPGDRLWDMLPQIRAGIISEQPPLRAVFTSHDTPGSLDPGSTLDVHLKVRNSGSLTWAAGGQGAVSLGYQWLTADGKPVKGITSKRVALPHDVPFADSIDLVGKLTAPRTPGHYALVWDMYRDGQGWFADQGSRPLRVDVVVGKSVGDKTAPKSSVLPLPIYSSNSEVIVRWAGTDEPRGSGIASYDIQVRVAPNGEWKDWQSATAQTQAPFEGEDGYTYEFRSRARDAAGNVEAWPDKAQAFTTIDTRPPMLVVDSPKDHEHLQPGPVQVTGHTDPGAFVTVNDRRAVEAGGVFTATVMVEGRDFVIHVMAADPAGNVARQEVIVQAAPRYNDVGLNHPDSAAIEQLSDLGVVSGYPDGSFRPNAVLTRGQLAKMIALSRQWGLIKPMESRFTDVPADSWQFAYVETVAARGAMSGYPDGSFHPNDPATRAVVAKAVVVAAGWKPRQPMIGIFADVPVGHWAAWYVEAARGKGIVEPDEQGYFYPNSAATRAYSCEIIYQMLSRLEITPNEPSPEPASGGQ